MTAKDREFKRVLDVRGKVWVSGSDAVLLHQGTHNMPLRDSGNRMVLEADFWEDAL